MTTTLKTCFKCSEHKPLTEFYPHKQMGDGYLNKCKECAKRDEKIRRELDPEKKREYDRQRANLPHRVEARRVYAKTLTGSLRQRELRQRWLEKNPQKKEAYHITSNAMRDGKLQKEPCFVCGSEDAEAHHSMYDEPLAVTWLCPTHHAQTHREHRQWLREMGVHKQLRQKV